MAKPQLVWEAVKNSGEIWSFFIARAKVPGGWLGVYTHGDGGGITFVPDPNYTWQ